jgi:hypothetical protein
MRSPSWAFCGLLRRTCTSLSTSFGVIHAITNVASTNANMPYSKATPRFHATRNNIAARTASALRRVSHGSILVPTHRYRHPIQDGLQYTGAGLARQLCLLLDDQTVRQNRLGHLFHRLRVYI